MLISRLINEFGEYCNTADYLHGILVEISGILVEVILLSILIPIILYFIRKFQTKHIKATVDFYLFQIFHKVTRMFLRMASVENIMPVLEQEQKMNPKLEIYSHYVYGNLENILFVLKKILTQDNTFIIEVEKRNLNEFKEFRDISDRCIEEIDRLTAMLVGVPKVQQELFEMRILFYPLRDLCEEIIGDIQNSDQDSLRRKSHSYDLHTMASELTMIIDEIFKKRRKHIDSVMAQKQWFLFARMVLPLPYIMVRRWVEIRICRIKKKPYRDFISPSPIPDMLHEWRSLSGLTLKQAGNILGISEEDYYDYEQGYRKPSARITEKIKPELNKNK